MRQGVVLCSTDSTAAAFVRDLVEYVRAAPLLWTERGRTCVAVASGTRRRRLVIIDGDPPDQSMGTLIEAIRLVDTDVPIVLVGAQAGVGSKLGRVVACTGPLVRSTTEQILLVVLAESAP